MNPWTTLTLLGLLGAAGCGAATVVQTTADASLSDAPPRDVAPDSGGCPLPAAPRDAEAPGAGSRRTNCAVRRDGSVWCWGSSALATSSDSPTPRLVPGYRDVVALWPRGEGFVVRFRDGHYEANVFGRMIDIPSDATLDGAAGTNHLCYRLPDGTVRCLGTNANGKVGNGSSAWPGDVTEAVDPGLRGVRSVVTGSYHSCAILADGTVSCWGSNVLGALGFTTTQNCAGIGSTSECATRPGMVPGVDHVAQLFLGVWGTCALRLDRSVWCWGGLSPTRSMVPAPVDW